MTDEDDRSIDRYLASLDDEQTVKDSETLIEMMQRISGHAPTLWNVGTIGFGTYHYKYDSGREGDAAAVGFSPRKANLVLYGVTEGPDADRLLPELGKHRTSTACLYVNKLDDVDRNVLAELIRLGYRYVTTELQNH